MVAGLAGLVVDAGLTDPLGWALWFGGLIVAHDGVLVPLVLLTGVAVGRMREPSPVRAGLIVAAVLSLIALPMVTGFGRRADNPSLLPLDYGRNLLVVLGLVALVTALTATAVRLRAKRRRR
ncbi:hypothetical protein F5972_13360 [Microbispora cellulosiformans]|uniref:Uncharacterized protein n=1 Tax=Microbispora cellulosiformans TaxID=2614688 RepID=A0A5J5K5G5_9ACTN|nr:hypothetical protein F5972_13360 [Microbispora cellulosiformans]